MTQRKRKEKSEQDKPPKKQPIPALAEERDKTNIAIARSSKEEDVYNTQHDCAQLPSPSTGPHDCQYYGYNAWMPKTMATVDPPDLFF